MKILFLDFDGPVIPQRAYAYNLQQRDKWNKGGLIHRYMDPSAVAIVKDVLVTTGAQLVISSSWRRLGYEGTVEVLEFNDISRVYLHEDWRTDTGSKKFILPPADEKTVNLDMKEAHEATKAAAEDYDKRANRILRWVAEHPDVTEWVAVDDEPLADDTAHGNPKIAPNFVHVTLENGILHEHHGLLLYSLLRDEVGEKCPGLPYTKNGYTYAHNWLWCDKCRPLCQVWQGKDKETIV